MEGAKGLVYCNSSAILISFRIAGSSIVPGTFGVHLGDMAHSGAECFSGAGFRQPLDDVLDQARRQRRPVQNGRCGVSSFRRTSAVARDTNATRSAFGEKLLL